MRTNPLERLLLPLDADAEPGQAQAAPCVRARCPDLDRRETGIPVEAVRVGDERPELVGTRPELPDPVVAELSQGGGEAGTDRESVRPSRAPA
jgi:hypothetical protein